MSAKVLLVDDTDTPVGTAEKVKAHTEGWLHRAFSVFVFNARGHLLLQQRSPGKYHSGGLWSNTCCSHPQKDEHPLEGARRRLGEEMGFDSALTPALRKMYHMPVGPDLVEHEYNHVFVGRVEEPHVRPSAREVANWAWVPVSDLRKDLIQRPEQYTSWFPLLLANVLKEVAPDENGRSIPNTSG